MRNPNHPDRKIRHAKILTQAGFQIDRRWYVDGEKARPATSCSKLIYWRRGDIRVTMFDSDTISLTKLVDQIIEQAEYRMRCKAKVTF